MLIDFTINLSVPPTTALRDAKTETELYKTRYNRDGLLMKKLKTAVTVLTGHHMAQVTMLTYATCNVPSEPIMHQGLICARYVR